MLLLRGLEGPPSILREARDISNEDSVSFSGTNPVILGFTMKLTFGLKIIDRHICTEILTAFAATSVFFSSFSSFSRP